MIFSSIKEILFFAFTAGSILIMKTVSERPGGRRDYAPAPVAVYNHYMQQLIIKNLTDHLYIPSSSHLALHQLPTFHHLLKRAGEQGNLQLQCRAKQPVPFTHHSSSTGIDAVCPHRFVGIEEGWVLVSEAGC